MDCLFCKIIAGDIPCTKVYEDDDVVAFMDIAPTSKGHTLVVPKQHTESLLTCSVEQWRSVTEAVRRLAPAVKQGSNADGLNLGMNNGQAAGQVVPHLHVHLIPRHAGDHFPSWGKVPYAEGEMERYAERIRRAM